MARQAQRSCLFDSCGEARRKSFVQALAFGEEMTPHQKIRRVHAVVSRLGTKLENEEEQDVFNAIKMAISLLASISAPQETPQVICGYRPDMAQL